LRMQIPEVRIFNICGGGSLKSQMKRADKSRASIALILADNELDNQVVTVKYLRNDSMVSDKRLTQEQLSYEEVLALLKTVVL